MLAGALQKIETVGAAAIKRPCSTPGKDPGLSAFSLFSRETKYPYFYVISPCFKTKVTASGVTLCGTTPTFGESLEGLAGLNTWLCSQLSFMTVWLQEGGA